MQEPGAAFQKRCVLGFELAGHVDHRIDALVGKKLRLVRETSDILDFRKNGRIRHRPQAREGQDMPERIHLVFENGLDFTKLRFEMVDIGDHEADASPRQIKKTEDFIKQRCLRFSSGRG